MNISEPSQRGVAYVILYFLHVDVHVDNTTHTTHSTHSSSVTPDQWASFSNVNIIKAEKERNVSSILRGVINGVLEQTKQDIEKQRASVNLAFAKRIHETSEAKQHLEHHLDKVGRSCVSLKGGEGRE